MQSVLKKEGSKSPQLQDSRGGQEGGGREGGRKWVNKDVTRARAREKLVTQSEGLGGRGDGQEKKQLKIM